MDYITVVGLLAATCTTASFVPQSIKTIKTRHTKDLSLGMYSLLTAGLLLWLIYGVLIQDFPIVIANMISITMSVTILVLKIKNG